MESNRSKKDVTITNRQNQHIGDWQASSLRSHWEWRNKLECTAKIHFAIRRSDEVAANYILQKARRLHVLESDSQKPQPAYHNSCLAISAVFCNNVRAQGQIAAKRTQHLAQNEALKQLSKQLLKNNTTVCATQSERVVRIHQHFCLLSVDLRGEPGLHSLRLGRATF